MNRKALIRYGAGILLFLAAGVLFLVSMPKKKDITVISADGREISAGTPGEGSGRSQEAETRTEADGSGKGSLTQEERPEKLSEESGPDQIQSESPVWVHVCGEVLKPGVYELPAGTRIADAISAAGGLTRDAAGEAVNQALKAEDGQQIYVPSKEEAARGGDRSSAGVFAGTAGTAGAGTDGNQDKVNLNTADLAELMTLPGIGSAKAESIIAYRNEHGRFQSAGEIKNISGIKDSVYNQIKDRVTVE